MATRRSRLQIKPNIGPRGPAAVPPRTSSPAVNKSNKEAGKFENVDVSNAEEKQKSSSPAKGLQARTVAVEDQISEPDIIRLESPSPAAHAGKTSPSKPTKVSEVVSATNPAKQDELSENVDSAETQSVPPSPLLPGGAVPSDKPDGISKVSSSPKRLTSNQAKTSTIKPTAVLRNRLPKAKPNLAEAGRRKTNSASVLPVPEKEKEKPSTPGKSKEKLDKTVNSTSEDTEHAEAAATLKSPVRVSESSPRKTLSHLSEVPPHSNVRSLSASQSSHCDKTDERPSAGEKRPHSASTGDGKKTRKRPRVVEAPVDQPPDRTKMKMRDLIYWNPQRNPIKPNEEKEKPVEKVVENIAREITPAQPTQEEIADDPEDDQDENDLPVPQVKIGPDGSIILNEASLVVETEKDKAEESTADIIHESAETFVTYASFRNKRNAKLWTDKETDRFFKALSCVGTDFSLMLNIFPKRTRHELKNKFKREEKANKSRVDSAVREKQHFDLSFFENDDNEEEENTSKKSKKQSKKKNDEEKKSKVSKKRNEEKDDFVGPKSSAGDSAPKERPKRANRGKRKSNLNYYDGSDSEIEESRKSRKNRHGDTHGQAKSIDQAGEEEVVNILVGMSEGRVAQPGSSDAQAGNMTKIKTPSSESKTTSKKGPPTNRNQVANVIAPSGVRSVQLIDNNQLAIPGVSDDSEGRFILVTVVPEDGHGETVIHVYRVQPGPGEQANELNSTTQTGPIAPIMNSSQEHHEISENVALNISSRSTSEPLYNTGTTVSSESKSVCTETSVSVPVFMSGAIVSPASKSDIRTGVTPEPSSDKRAGVTPEPTSDMITGVTHEPTSDMRTGVTHEPTLDIRTSVTPEPTSDMRTGVTPEPTSDMRTGVTPEPTSDMRTGVTPEPTPDMRTDEPRSNIRKDVNPALGSDITTEVPSESRSDFGTGTTFTSLNATSESRTDIPIETTEPKMCVSVDEFDTIRSNRTPIVDQIVVSIEPRTDISTNVTTEPRIYTSIGKTDIRTTVGTKITAVCNSETKISEHATSESRTYMSMDKVADTSIDCDTSITSELNSPGTAVAAGADVSFGSTSDTETFFIST